MEQRALKSEMEVVMDTVPVAIWIAHDPECRLVKGNRAAYDLLKLPFGPNLSKSNPDNLDARFRIVRNGVELAARDLALETCVRENRDIDNFEDEFVLADGTVKRVLGACRPLRDETGRAQGGVAVFQDVTALKSVQAELAATVEKAEHHRSQMEAIFQAVDDGIAVFDLAGNAVLVNQALSRITGLENTALDKVGAAYWSHTYELSQSGQEPLPPEERPMAKVLRGDSIRDWELRVRRRDTGQEWYISYSGQPVRDRSGQPVFALILTRDVTNRKLAENALRESEERFRILADNIAQLAWMADTRGHIFWFNQRWLEYTGLSMAESIDGGWKKIQHPNYVAKVDMSFQQSMATGNAWEETFPLRGRNGGYRWFLLRAIPVRDREGRIFRWLGTNTDVTAQREAEQRLREADRHKDEFLAMLAHELRNPLSLIRATLELFRRQHAGAGPVFFQRLDRISRQVDHLTHIVNDLLDTSRVSRGLFTLQREQIRLADAVNQALEDNQPAIEAHRQVLHVHLQDENLVVDADLVRMVQIISNLINNASKYTPQGGQIWVREFQERGQAVIEVTDTGVGLAPDFVDYIFDVFVQADKSLARTKGGLGLGLTLVKKLTELHGGTVEARSPGLGRGSTFVVRLPLSASQSPAVAGQAKAANPIQPEGHLRVLVVEDNRDAAEAMHEVLESWGYQAWLASDGPSGLAQAIALKPDVVLLDIGLPGMDGYEVAHRIHENPSLAATDIVAITGYNPDPQRNAEAGFNDYFTKPIDLDRLDECLREFEHDKGTKVHP